MSPAKFPGVIFDMIIVILNKYSTLVTTGNIIATLRRFLTAIKSNRNTKSNKK